MSFRQPSAPPSSAQRSLSEMSRAFTQGDITRLARGVRKAGFSAVRIEVKPSGEIVAEGREESEDTATDWDKAIRAEKAAKERH